MCRSLLSTPSPSSQFSQTENTSTEGTQFWRAIEILTSAIRIVAFTLAKEALAELSTAAPGVHIMISVQMSFDNLGSRRTVTVEGD